MAGTAPSGISEKKRTAGAARTLLRISRVTMRLAELGIALVLARALVLIIQTPAPGSPPPDGLPPLTPTALIVVLLWQTLTSGILVYALWVVRSLFRRIADGQMIIAATAEALKHLAAALLLLFALSSPTAAFIMFVFGLPDPGHQDPIVAGLILMANYGTLLAGCVVGALSLVMREAVRLKAENDEFV